MVSCNFPLQTIGGVFRKFSYQVHTHLPNSNSIFDYVSRDALPTEYGGLAGEIEDLKRWWIEKVMEHRDYINDESRWAVDETKRSGGNSNLAKNVFGMEGSFRSLSID